MGLSVGKNAIGEAGRLTGACVTGSASSTSPNPAWISSRSTFLPPLLVHRSDKERFTAAAGHERRAYPEEPSRGGTPAPSGSFLLSAFLRPGDRITKPDPFEADDWPHVGSG